jgi:hypothetical protein
MPLRLRDSLLEPAIEAKRGTVKPRACALFPISLGLIQVQTRSLDSSAGRSNHEEPKLLLCSNPRSLGKGRETALGWADARPRPTPAHRRRPYGSGHVGTWQAEIAGSKFRILARSEQDPRALRWRRQRPCGRQAQWRWSSRIEKPPALRTSAGQQAFEARYSGTSDLFSRFGITVTDQSIRIRLTSTNHIHCHSGHFPQICATSAGTSPDGDALHRG